MMKRIFSLLTVAVCAMTAIAATKAVFLTGGQSNTDGRLYATTLPAYLQSANSYCLASCHGAYSADRLGVFYPYYPTSGTEGQPGRWAYDAVTYYYIGQALQETFYVAKTSYGGTSIHPSISNSGGLVEGTSFLSQYGSGYHWSADPVFLEATAIAGTTFEKGGTTYTGQSMLLAWIANIDATIDAIKAKGDTPDIKAMIWHQGESDKNAGSAYHDNLQAVVAYVRQHLVEKTGESKYANLPFFCGTIPHASSLVNSAVEKAFFTLEEEDDNFHVIDLRDLTMLSDAKHFDAPSAELFGKRLYNRMVDEGVINGTRLDDVKYAEVDYSDFGTDEFVGEEKTWTFEQYTSNLVTKTTIQDGLYLHSNNSNSRNYLSQAAAVSSVTFKDGTQVTTSRVLTSNNGGAYGWSADNIAKETNASRNLIHGVGANIIYPGRFSMMVSAPEATADAPATMQLLFNGKVVDELVFTDTTPQELFYDASQAGTFYFYSPKKFSLYAVRYVPTEDRLWQRTIKTDKNGYAVFGNLSGANVTLPKNLTAWAVSVSTENAQQVVLDSIGVIGKGEAALLYGAPNKRYVLPFSWEADSTGVENSMTAQQQTGEIEETSGEDFVNYIFDEQQFVKVSGKATVNVAQAYLSISNGTQQCQYDVLTFSQPDFTPERRNFGTDVVVSAATTWTLDDYPLPGSDGVVVEKNGLYSRAQNGSSNRSWKAGTQTAKGMAFGDGSGVEVSGYFYLNNACTAGNALTAATTANNTALSDYFAINASVPGTFYVLVASNQADKTLSHNLYFNGAYVASTQSTSTDAVELSYTAEDEGTFVYYSGAQHCRVYAFRFVPTTDEPVGVETVESKSRVVGVEAIYTMNGVKVLTPQHGINVVRYADGTVRKVYVQ